MFVWGGGLNKLRINLKWVFSSISKINTLNSKYNKRNHKNSSSLLSKSQTGFILTGIYKKKKNW